VEATEAVEASGFCGVFFFEGQKSERMALFLSN
jgi:hypothetical protein